MKTFNDLYKSIIFKLLQKSNDSTRDLSFKSDRNTAKCKVESCQRGVCAHGYCNAHYLRHLKSMDMSLPIKSRKNDNRCSICNKVIGGKGAWGLCKKHYMESRTSIIKDTIIEFFGNKCNSCNLSFPSCCYDFHHIDKTNKEFTISNMFTSNGIEEICKEISKCEMLCSNCHRLHHYNENKNEKEL